MTAGGAVPSLLPDACWVRLLTVPRLADPGRPPDEGAERRTTLRRVAVSVAAAHAELRGLDGAPAGLLASLWVRPPGYARTAFLLGGSPGLPPAQGDGAGGTAFPVLHPPGATGEAIAPSAVAELLSALPAWVPCLGGPDALRPDEPPDRHSPGLLDDYVAHVDSPFAWCVLARPAPPEALDAERDALLARAPLLRQRENSEAHRVELERTEGRFRELARAAGTGMWHVRILVGGPSQAAARRLAALFCGASEGWDLPYLLRGGDDARDLATAASAELTDGGLTTPLLASTELVAHLTRPPSRELPGIRAVTPMAFDVTPEESPGARHLALGEVVDEALTPVGDLLVTHDTVNRHAFICGATGSGKSQSARHLLEQLSTGTSPVPWLVVEPAKAEYARMQGRLGPHRRLVVIRPGDLDSPPASLNPLEPEPGFGLQSHADLVRALFLAAFEAQEPFPQVLSEALTACYQSAGWDLVTGQPRAGSGSARHARPRYPGLGDLQSAARGVVERIGYGPEVAANVRGFVDVRIGSLRAGTPGRFFEGGHPLDVGALLRREAVLELESITNDQDKAFLMGAVLIRVVEHLRVHEAAHRGRGLSHVLLIEEAHRLLKKVESGPAAAAVELFASLLAEIRAYGEGVVVVEQIPAKIVPDVIKNTALKVVHRLPAQDDRDAVGATMNLQEQQSENVVSFPPGLAAIAMDGTDRPLLVRVPPGVDREDDTGIDLTAPLAGRRSPLCGASCGQRPCSLREMNAAQVATQNPEAVVWVEAVTAAFVVGVEPPAPRTSVTRAWHGDERRRDCAVGIAVDRAIDARRVLLRAWLDPNALAARVAGVVAAHLAGGAIPWDRSERPLWRAGYYRYLPEWLALADALDAPGASEDDAPHPRSHEWAERGLVLDGPTLGAQLGQIRRHPSFAPGSRRVVFGDTRTSGLHDALTELGGDTSPAAAARVFEHVCTGPGLPALVASLEDLLS